MTTPKLDLSHSSDLTTWLEAQDAGEPNGAQPGEAQTDVSQTGRQDSRQAVNQLFASLYEQLKRQANAQMRREYAGHTLSATALTHEAWERLAAQTRTQWASRAHFLAMASVMMRRILVNHALAKQADKRDVALVSLTLTEAQQIAASGGSAGGPSGPNSPDVIAVHDALLAFEQVDARAAKVVELKFFGGLEIDEIAELLNLSAATVKRDWLLARAWLHRELSA